MNNGIMDITERCCIEFDITLTATFYMDTRMIYDGALIFYKDSVYKITDWSYSKNEDEVMAKAELTLLKLSYFKI